MWSNYDFTGFGRNTYEVFEIKYDISLVFVELHHNVVSFGSINMNNEICRVQVITVFI